MSRKGDKCVYDYTCTFLRKTSIIWKAKWTLPKVLYIIVRFQPLATLPLGIYLIFIMWTWALWGRTRNILIFLSTFFLGILFTGAVVLAKMDRELGSPSAGYRLTMCTKSSSKINPQLKKVLYEPFIMSTLVVIFYLACRMMLRLRKLEHRNGTEELSSMRASTMRFDHDEENLDAHAEEFLE
ncbi:hypothetical protein C0995_004060 [Termitomyces sp. Mi166|nr:hypothetical protein C0995_004060 [Termitomyces sp. Mi166\